MVEIPQVAPSLLPLLASVTFIPLVQKSLHIIIFLPISCMLQPRIYEVKGGAMTSGDSQFDPRLLWQLPLIELNIDVRLRRMLINAGFSSLGEAFDLSDRELDSRIGPDAEPDRKSVV